MDIPYEPIFWDIETTGFNPLHQDWYDDRPGARVLSVGIGTIDGWRDAEGIADVEFDVTVYWDSSEYNLLGVVSDRIEDKIRQIKAESYETEAFLVGWNSRNFDHPYIGARYSRLRLDGHYFTHGMKRLDMMRALGNDEVSGSMYPGQDDYAKALGIDVAEELTGADMPDAFKAGDWSKIEQHCEEDMVEMMKVFVERRGPCMEELYNHYDDITGRPPRFDREVEY